jgi:hypothetical protein
LLAIDTALNWARYHSNRNRCRENQIMETIRKTAQVENGHITVDVPAHWRDREVDVVLVARDPADSRLGEGAFVMEHVKSILAQGGVRWPMDVMEWQRQERQDRALPGRE